MTTLIPILLYHSVDDRFSDHYRPYCLTQAEFFNHMAQLSQSHCRTVTIAELIAMFRKGEAIPPRTVAITFDDGLRDFLTGALPILLRHGFKTTLYTVSGSIGGTSRWLSRLGEGGRPMLSWSELREVSDAGIEIGAHSISHPELDVLSAATAKVEIEGSKSAIEDKLGRRVESFAYPHGYSSYTTRLIVREAGYFSACRVRNAFSSAAEDVYALSRIVMDKDVGMATLKNLLNGAGLPFHPAVDYPAATAWRMVRRLQHMIN